MRTHLITLAATLTVIGFASASVAATTGAGSSGGSGGGFSASGGGGASSGGSGGGSSHGGGGGGGGGAAHGGGSAGGAANRAGGFEGRSGFNGYGNFGSPGRDIAHGGYQVLATRPANMIASAATPAHSTHASLVLGPALGSAAQAVRMTDDRHGWRPDHDGHGRHPHELRRGTLFQAINCGSNGTLGPYGCNGVPEEMCPHWVIRDGETDDMNSPLGCPQPFKLAPIPRR
jgi:hypothetical protein